MKTHENRGTSAAPFLHCVLEKWGNNSAINMDNTSLSKSSGCLKRNPMPELYERNKYVDYN